MHVRVCVGVWGGQHNSTSVALLYCTELGCTPTYLGVTNAVTQQPVLVVTYLKKEKNEKKNRYYKVLSPMWMTSMQSIISFQLQGLCHSKSAWPVCLLLSSHVWFFIPYLPACSLWTPWYAWTAALHIRLLEWCEAAWVVRHDVKHHPQPTFCQLCPTSNVLATEWNCYVYNTVRTFSRLCKHSCQSTALRAHYVRHPTTVSLRAKLCTWFAYL
jgi:hypothetical protein